MAVFYDEIVAVCKGGTRGTGNHVLYLTFPLPKNPSSMLGKLDARATVLATGTLLLTNVRLLCNLFPVMCVALILHATTSAANEICYVYSI
jgi:hypothetical protein